MHEPKTNCINCGTEFLQATADCTDGKCLPCYKGVPLADRKTGVTSLNPVEKISFGDWVKAGILGIVGVGIFLLVNPVLGLFTALTAHYVFGVSWSGSCFAGFMVYLGLGFLSSIGDIPEAVSEGKKDVKMKEFKKKWQETHGKGAEM